METLFISNGVYSVAEAARYTGTKPSRLYSWFRDPARHVFESDYAGSKLPRAISFLDLIDALVVAEMRKLNISMKHIREVHEVLSDELKTDHPFCTKQFCVDISERRIIQIVEETDNRILVDALKKQGQFESVIAPSLRQIEYDPDSELAELWKISEGVTLNPRVLYGKPVVEGTRIPTQVIASQYYAYENSADAVASIYDITEANVLNAVRFEAQKGTVKLAA